MGQLYVVGFAVGALTRLLRRRLPVVPARARRARPARRGEREGRGDALDRAGRRSRPRRTPRRGAHRAVRRRRRRAQLPRLGRLPHPDPCGRAAGRAAGEPLAADGARRRACATSSPTRAGAPSRLRGLDQFLRRDRVLDPPRLRGSLARALGGADRPRLRGLERGVGRGRPHGRAGRRPARRRPDDDPGGHPVGYAAAPLAARVGRAGRSRCCSGRSSCRHSASCSST